jgi:hypothetical protein
MQHGGKNDCEVFTLSLRGKLTGDQAAKCSRHFVRHSGAAKPVARNNGFTGFPAVIVLAGTKINYLPVAHRSSLPVLRLSRSSFHELLFEVFNLPRAKPSRHFSG